MKSIKAFLCIATFGYWLICSACVNESKPAVETQKKSIQQTENKNQDIAVSQKEINQQKPDSHKKSDISSQDATSKKNSTTNSSKSKANKKKPVGKQTGKIPAKKGTPKTPTAKSIVINSNKSEKERLTALQTFDNRISNKTDYEVLKSLVQRENELLKIRQEALKKIYTLCGQDEDSSSLFQKKQADFLNALKTGLYNTKDKKTYNMLLKALADANDPTAHQTVIDMLKQEDFSKLSSKQLLQFLKKNVRPKHYASLHRIMQNTDNTEIKNQLIPLLIKHPNSKAQILQYLGNKAENIKTRLTCADVLMDDDAPSFYTYAKNIIWNKEGDIKLRRHCLSLINEADKKNLEKYAGLQDDMLNIGLSDNVLNELREALLKKLTKNQY